MKLARIDPFACVAKHETTAARQRPNTAQPVRRLEPPHLDTGHSRPIGWTPMSVNSGCARRDRCKAASHVISPVAILLAARHLPYWSTARE